jgi:maleylacetate reductase
MADFTWRDGERLVRFRRGALEEAVDLVAGVGLTDFALLTTERAAAGAPALVAAADGVVHVPPGKVDEVSAGLLGEVEDRDLVALGGGRVVDTAKAVAGVYGHRCAAVPTTLSGAEMTPFHRTPAGVEGARLVRPALVVADPDLMAAQPGTQLAASAMNAMAHAMEALYTPFANPVGDIAALKAATLLASGITQDPPDTEDLALGALLAGYSSGAAGIAVHHAVCQTVVRVAGTPHAETNAVMLPHSARFMTNRAPAALSALAGALGDPQADPAMAAGMLSKLAGRSGHTRLSTLGAGEEHVDEVAATVAQHPLLGNTPDPPSETEIAALVREAL